MDESAFKHAEEIFAMQFDEHKYVFMCKNIIKVFVASTHQNKGKENEKLAVNNVTFGIKKNEIFGLIGPNGSGKSTLISMITQQLEQDSGDFIVDSA